MKKLLLSFLFVLSIVGAKATNEHGKTFGPDITKKTLDLPEFNNISLNSNYTVYVKQTNKQEVTVEALSEVYAVSEFKVENKTLHINIKKKKDAKGKSFWSKIDDIKIRPTLRVIISVKSLQNVMVNGGGKVIAENSINSNSLSLAVNGSGSMEMDIKGKDVTASVTGSGEMTLKGYATKSKVSVSGSGVLHAFDLELENGVAKVTGSGNCEVNVTNELNAQIYGTGNIKHKGNTKNVVKKEYGAGVVSRAY